LQRCASWVNVGKSNEDSDNNIHSMPLWYFVDILLVFCWYFVEALLMFKKLIVEDGPEQSEQ
jgi:hypothetical protein